MLFSNRVDLMCGFKTFYVYFIKYTKYLHRNVFVSTIKPLFIRNSVTRVAYKKDSIERDTQSTDDMKKSLENSL